MTPKKPEFAKASARKLATTRARMRKFRVWAIRRYLVAQIEATREGEEDGPFEQARLALLRFDDLIVELSDLAGVEAQ